MARQKTSDKILDFIMVLVVLTSILTCINLVLLICTYVFGVDFGDCS